MTVYGLQFDSVSGLPFTPQLHLLYINGRYATRPDYGRGRVYIDVIGDAAPRAMWLDVERYDATPDQAPGWLRERMQSTGQIGGIYCDRSSLPEVEKKIGPFPHLLTVATLDGTTDIGPIPGAGKLVAVQAFPAVMVGPSISINADISVVVDRVYWQDHALSA